MFCRSYCGRKPCIGENGQELIAANAPEVMGRRQLEGYERCEFNQHSITLSVTQCVVATLEVVDVDE